MCILLSLPPGGGVPRLSAGGIPQKRLAFRLVGCRHFCVRRIHQMALESFRYLGKAWLLTHLRRLFIRLGNSH